MERVPKETPSINYVDTIHTLSKMCTVSCEDPIPTM